MTGSLTRADRVLGVMRRARESGRRGVTRGQLIQAAGPGWERVVEELLCDERYRIVVDRDRDTRRAYRWRLVLEAGDMPQAVTEEPAELSLFDTRVGRRPPALAIDHEYNTMYARKSKGDSSA
jgi:hypothetical protein